MKKGKEINGEVKIFYSRTQIPNFDEATNTIGLNSLSDLELEAYGYYDVIDNPITEYQRYDIILPEHLVGNQYITPIIDFTQAEIDAYDAEVLAQAEREADNKFFSMIEENLKSDGERKFNRIRFKLRKEFELGGISKNNFLKLRRDITPLILPLLQGDFDIAKEKLDAFALTVPYTNATQLGLLNFAKDVVNNYITKNY